MMRFSILAGLAAAAVMLAAPARAETVVLAADEWCPYNCDPASDKPGFMVEIAREALGRHGVTVEYVVLPWARAIEEVRANKYGGIIGAYYGDAEDFIYPEAPQGRSAMTFYTGKDSAWNFTAESDLEKLSLGAVADYSYSVALDAYIEKHKADPARVQIISGDNAMDANIQKLAHGRIGAMIEDKYVMDYHMSAPESATLKGQIREAGLLPSPDDGNGIVFVAFSPAHPRAKEYAKILTDETKAMRASGDLKKILDRYGLKDFEDEPQ